MADSKKTHLAVLTLGILLTLCGAFFLLQRSPAISISIKNTIFVVLFFLAGLVFIVGAVTGDRSVLPFFFGFFSMLVGFILILSGFGDTLFTFKQFWPAYVIAFGLSFAFAGLVSHKKILAFFTIPGASLIILGVFFLLFSLKVIPVSFAQFASRWWPLLLIIVGVCLLVVFYRMQKSVDGSERLFQDEVDEYDYPD